MKRAGPLRRRTGLKRSWLRRRPMVRGRVVKGRYRATSSEWADLLVLLKLTHRCCQVCRRDDCGPLGAHHLVGRDLGGDDVFDNLALLGGSGTSGCHGKVQELDPEACWMLRTHMKPEQALYVARKAGAGTLDRYYPAAPPPHKEKAS